MAYVTQDDLEALGIPAEALAGLSNDQISLAITWAGQFADGYLRKRHKLPLVEGSTGYDLGLKMAVAAVAAYRLMGRRGFRPGSGLNELIVKNYDDAVTWLRDVASGRIELANDDQTTDIGEEGTLAASDPAPSFSLNAPGRCSTHDPGHHYDDDLLE